MILVPAGEYLVGAAEHLANPRRRVKLATYRISDAETTNAQFSRFVEATGYVTDAERVGFGMVCREGMLDWEWEQVKGACWRFPQGPGQPSTAELPDHPVTQISGRDAEAYCRWRGGRLPSLEEWEVAARAGRDTRFPWGEELEPKKANIWNGESHRKNTLVDGFMYTAPVRSFLPNAWGLHDVIGNVFEYCTGFSLVYEGRETSELSSARGGSWWCSQGTCNYFNLEDIGAIDRRGSFGNQGFRLVLPAGNTTKAEEKSWHPTAKGQPLTPSSTIRVFPKILLQKSGRICLRPLASVRNSNEQITLGAPRAEEAPGLVRLD